MQTLNEFDKIEMDMDKDPDVIFEDELDTLEDEELPFAEESSGDHYANIISLFDPEEVDALGQKALEEYQEDLGSRSEWEETITAGLRRLGITEGSSEDPVFEGACNVEHPIILESVISYQSRTSSEILPATGPVKVQVMGKKTPFKERQAARVQRHMNWQLTSQIEEYVSETEKMLFFVPLVGNGFKKKHFCSIRGRIVDSFILPSNVVVNAGATSLNTAERISNKIIMSEREFDQNIRFEEFQPTETYADSFSAYEVAYSDFEQALNDCIGISLGGDLSYEIIEQQRYIPVVQESSKFRIDPKNGEHLPFTVIIEKMSGAVLSIKRNWASWDGIRRQRFNFISHYQFVPNGNFYGFGFIHLLGNLQKTLTITLRSLMDAGQFANLSAGFKRAGLKIADADRPLSPGEFRDIQVHGDIAEALHIIKFNEPSPVLFEIMKAVEGNTKQFADSTQAVVSNSTNYGPVGTTMALLEASAKFFGAIHKRAFFSQEHELKVVAALNFEFLDDTNIIDVPSDVLEVQRSDYDPTAVNVKPVSDPNKPSQAQRLSIAQAKLTAALQQPGIHNMKAVYAEFYRTLDPDADYEILTTEEEAQPNDPLTDLETMLNNKPIKAFEGQDHNAHIAVKMSWLQNPEQGGSPIMQGYANILLANIREHQFMIYKAQLGALQEKGFDVVKASEELRQLAELKKEVEADGSPAALIAKAEWLKAQTDAKTEERKGKEAQINTAVKVMDSATRQAEAKIRAEKVKSEIDLKRAEMAGEFILDGLKEAGTIYNVSDR